MGAACVDGVGNIPSSTCLEKCSCLEWGTVFSIYIRLCNDTHNQKEREQREQMSPCLICIALCVLTAPDGETLQIIG